MARSRIDTAFFIRSLTGAFFVLCAMAAPAQMPGGPAKPVPLPHPEIAAPNIPDPGLPIWAYVVGVLLLISFLALLLWLFLRPDPPARRIPPAPLQRALDMLKEVRTHLDTIPPPEVAHHVSVILRIYQEGRYAVPAPYRTSEELYHSLTPSLKEGIQQRFSPLAQMYDRLSFAPVPATRRDAEHLIDAAQTALEQENEQSKSLPPPLPASVSAPV